MSRARREGESISDQRSDNRDLLWILPDDAFGHAHEEIHTARHLHCRRGHYDRQYDDEHFTRKRARWNAKPNHQHEQADRAPQAEPHAA